MEKKTFSNETLNAAVAAMGELHDEIDQLRTQMQNEPVNETAQRYLMDKLGMTQSEAEEICDNIQKGISEFESQFNANSEKGCVSLREKLEEAMSNMDDKKKIEYLSAILTAFQVSKEQSMAESQISELQSKNAELSVDELINQIESVFGDKFNLEGLAEFVEGNIDADSIIKLAREIDMNKDDYRFLSAVILYEEQQNGKIKLSDSEEPIPADLLGSLACASIEVISATGDLKEGKIDLKRWQTIVKWILGTLLACSLGYLALLAIAYAAGSIVGLMLSVFGFSTIALIVTTIVSLFACWNLGKYSSLTITSILELLSSVYDQYIEPLTQKIKSLAAVVQNWFKSIFKKSESETQTSANAEDVTTNETIAVQPNIVTA